MEDPDHPIIKDPWQFEIVGLNFQISPDDEFEFYLDLTLQKDGVTRRLRFYSPQSLEVEEGFPHSTGGLCITDVRARGLDRLGVRVDDFEASRGAIRFWARTVIDLDEASLKDAEA